MAHLEGKERAAYVQKMFGRIASRYNLMNRLMTFGQDMRWRRFVVAQAKLPAGGKLLDLATGTGDIAFEAVKAVPDVQAVGADFALPMMRMGRQYPMGKRVLWSAADALNLPFPDNTFDAVTSGYLIRNVIDIPRTFAEQMRVLKPGGRIVVLDTSPPPKNLMRPFILIQLKYIIPLLGRLISPDGSAYQYLPESTQAFKTPDELASLMRQAGLKQVEHKSFMFGTMAVHWGEKAKDEAPMKAESRTVWELRQGESILGTLYQYDQDMWWHSCIFEPTSEFDQFHHVFVAPEPVSGRSMDEQFAEWQGKIKGLGLELVRMSDGKTLIPFILHIHEKRASFRGGWKIDG